MLHHEDNMSTEIWWENSFKKLVCLKLWFYLFSSQKYAWPPRHDKMLQPYSLSTGKITPIKSFQQYLPFTLPPPQKKKMQIKMLPFKCPECIPRAHKKGSCATCCVSMHIQTFIEYRNLSIYSEDTGEIHSRVITLFLLNEISPFAIPYHSSPISMPMQIIWKRSFGNTASKVWK